MTRHHTLMILLTFVMGFITGVFGYFWSRNVEEAPPRAPVEEGYELLVTAYGGCERIGCPSFRLNDDGTYQYLAPVSVRDYAKYEDTVSDKQHESISELVYGTDLERLTNSEFMGTCPVTYDGLAYRIEVRREGERYSLDSCENELEDEVFFVELTKYFGIMEATHGAY